jgi:uncharacterized protein YndB with AHSA1/START domain
MNSGEAAVDIRADPARLWAMVADITRMGEWSPETKRAEWLDGAEGPSVGARFKGFNQRGRSKWSTVCEVIDAVPARSFAFAVGTAAKPQTVWRYRFTPIDEGTRLTESFTLTKPLGIFSRLVTRLTIGVKDRQADLEEGLAATLAAIKRAAESEA